MPKQTLLDMVQSILSSMDSDEVNSISDTIESLQVAQIIHDTFYEIIQQVDIYQHKKLIQLSSATFNKPTHMSLPNNVRELMWVQYNRANNITDPIEYKDIHYKYPDEFILYINGRNPSNSDVDQISDNSGVVLNILNDETPSYWTSFDDTNIVFDSYDRNMESNLQNRNSLAYALITPSWSMVDDFIPDLPLDSFPWLLEESRSTAFTQLKQAPDKKAEQKAERQSRIMGRKNFKAKGGVRYPDYGRPTARHFKDPTFRRR